MVYRIDLSKEGFITKKLIIESKIPGIERLKYGEYAQKYIVKLEKGTLPDNQVKPYRKIKYFSNIKDYNDDPNFIPGNESILTNTNNQTVTNTPKPTDTKYTDAIKKGNDLLAQNKLPEAKLAFNDALIAKPGDKLAKDKIAEVDTKIKLATKAEEDKAKAEAEANQKKYENALAQGNKLMAAKQFELAKEQFQNALIAKPYDKVVLQKISDANRELAKGDELKRRQLKAIETLNLANTLLKQNKLPEAKLKYQEVLAIDPSNKDAGQKLKEIEFRQSGAQMSKNEAKKVAELIAQGDKNAAKENYPEALANYNEALKLNPNDKTIGTKINNANSNLNSKKDKLYARAISNGDQAMLGKDYEIAKLEYEKALALKPNEKYPKSQLKEVNKILLEMAKTLEEISKLSKERASTADVEYLKDKQLKQEKLKVMKKEQEYLERKMKNLSTKYNSENPITKLYNVVDLSEKNKK
jgi:tetratricopeptide (TPR) repeat protein